MNPAEGVERRNFPCGSRSPNQCRQIDALLKRLNLRISQDIPDEPVFVKQQIGLSTASLR